MTATDSTFRAAIPGMSMTHKMGDLPHEKPPKFTDKNQALEYFWKLLNQPKNLKQIWMIGEQGASARQIALPILYKAGLEGIIQMNLAITISGTLAQMIVTLCKSNGIDIPLLPKMRDSVKDTMKNKALNTKMGNKENPAIPASALKAMTIPKAQDITKGHKAFMKMNIQPSEPDKPESNDDITPGKGLLGGV